MPKSINVFNLVGKVGKLPHTECFVCFFHETHEDEAMSNVSVPQKKGGGGGIAELKLVLGFSDNHCFPQVEI